MKKIALTLLILSGFHLKINSQDLDTLSLTDYDKKSFLYARFQSGLVGGFQTISQDSVNLCLSIPLEISYRFYPRNSGRIFFDFDVGLDLTVLNEHSLYQTLIFKLGPGVHSRKFNYKFKYHVGYVFGTQKLNPSDALYKYRRMLNLGYAFETSAVPITMDLYLPTEKHTSSIIWLIGVKVPIINLEQ